MNAGCWLIAARSSEVRPAGLSRMRFEMPSLPISCSNPPQVTLRCRLGGSPRMKARPPAISPTCSEWLYVHGDLASITSAKARATRSRQASSAMIWRSSGSCSARKIRRVARGHPIPEAEVVLEGAQHVDEGRVEPAATALAYHLERLGRAYRAKEHLERLGQPDDTPQQRDALPLLPGRAASTVPVLVEVADRLSSEDREAQHQGDLGATIPARLHQLVGRAFDGNRDDLERAPERRALSHHVAGYVLDRLGQARPVGRLEVTLDGLVIGGEQVADFGRVAGAAKILEQQRIKQRRAIVGQQPDLLGDPHAQVAGADGVPLRLAFRWISSACESAETTSEKRICPFRSTAPTHPAPGDPSLQVKRAGACYCDNS